MNKIISNIIQLEAPRKIIRKKETINLDKLKNNEIVGKTIYSAISPGTELSAYKGEQPLRPGNVYPRLVGYCNIAKIIAVGNSVKKYKIDDIILTFESHRSYFITDEDSIITKVSKHTNKKKAVTTYLFHLGYNALLRGNFFPGQNIAIIGLGTIGTCTSILANYFGANTYGLSNNESALIRAKNIGCKDALKKNNMKISQIINEKTYRTGIDLVITTSNTWSDWKLALEIVRDGGKICVIGFPGRSKDLPKFNPLDSQYFYDKQLEIIACGYSSDYDIPPKDIRYTIKRNCIYLLDLISSDKIDPNIIISGMFNWENIEKAYKNLEKKEKDIFTYLLEW